MGKSYSTNELYIVGGNEYGCLALGNYNHVKELKQCDNNIFIIDISCGYSHNLAIDNNGNGYSWGNNYRD